jgi:ubiquinone/menaquinone biosynthesis C-methylase UbiE
MQKIILIILSILFWTAVTAQSIKTFCPESPKDTFYVKIASYLDLNKGDTLADIGSGFGYTMVRLGHYLPDVTFYEEDILIPPFPKLFYKSAIKKSCSSVDIHAFKFFEGTKTTTKFKNQSFNKVLIALSVHEFAYKEKMMLDVKRIMRKNARLYVLETFFKKEAPKEKNCKLPFMLKPDFLTLMANSGFELVREIPVADGEVSEDEMNEDPTHDYRNVTASFFEFRIKQ